MDKVTVFKEGVKLIALMQATLEQMDTLKGTVLFKHKLKLQMNRLEKELEATIEAPLRALDNADSELLTRIQYNIEMLMALSVDEIAILRNEIEDFRENNKERGGSL
jgi:hypothetical protein|tara:strand:- start:227 stop:547 length:321 start_codon:yes stop_codon:yes gene_type:complete